MDSNRWQRVQELFQHAISLEPSERDAYLQRTCEHDDALRAEVEALLRQDVSVDDAVVNVIGKTARALIETEARALVGKRLGAWQLGEQIARGGMGAVYRAERADGQFQQTAALKLLNPALLSPDALQRFNGERQILARLSHPNIARLIDGGTTDDGIPFLVMEFVDGVPIDTYCNEHRLDTPARLRLFQKVCLAVEYAHRNLVVHRDIKPSNIIVDASGEPKLLDFGVAKLIDRDQYLNPAAVTVAELRALTPRYASPEQLKGEPITTATDVYSLGVLLYELLTGKFPYRNAETSAADLQHAICEVDPERPSTAITRDDAESHQPLPPERVSRVLAGDLDNIALMALRKEPGRRYASALQLMEDIEHYLRSEPVLAQPNRWSYRTGKFIARHRIAVLAVSGFAVLLVSVVIFYTIQLAAQRDRARLEARKAADVSRFMTDLFKEADPNQALGKDVTARVLLERGAERAALELKNAPREQAALLRAIGESYANMAEYPVALKQIEKSIEIESRLGDSETATVYELRLLRGTVLVELGRYDEADTEFQAVRAYDAATYGRDSRETALVMRELGQLALVRGNFAQTLARYRQAIDVLRKSGNEGRADLAKTLDDYARALRDMSKLDEASKALRESIAIKLRVFGPTHPELAAAYNSLGNLDWARGDSREAKEYLNKAIELGRTLFGADSLRVARYRANLGNVEYTTGEYAKSELDSRAALAVFRRVLGEDNPQVAFLMDNLANALMEQGHVEEALQTYLGSIARLRKRFGDQHVEVARSRTNAAGALLQLGRYREARDMLLLAKPVLVKQFGDRQIEVLRCNARLGEAAAGLGQYREAESAFRRTIASYRELYKNEPNTDVARAYGNLGSTLLKQGKAAEAVETLRRSLTEWQRVNATADNTDMAETHAELGRALVKLHRYSDAVTEFSAAHRWFHSHLGDRDPLVAKTQQELAAARRAAGE